MTFTTDQFRLDGKVAIVTGAGGRGNSIGRAYAMGLAAAGAAVVVADLNEDGANADRPSGSKSTSPMKPQPLRWPVLPLPLLAASTF
jgi:NAD(P)-dependent dehydrogenase (short-subunit alcohol dehydrogenase family)